MFRICGFQLNRAFRSPRVYIAIFAGIAIQIISLMPLLEFSKSISKPLCIFESIIYSNSDLYAPFASFLAVLLLVSDIPFSTQSETYTLLRVSRKRWVAGKSLYLFCICVIYYAVTNLFGAIFISENAYMGNLWSMPLYSLTKDASSALTIEYNVYFPYGYILHNLSPAVTALLTYLLSVAYGTFMSLLVFYLNLKLSRALSYAATMFVHIISYTFSALSVSTKKINLSLFSNSLLMYHDIGAGSDEGFNTIPESFIIYTAIICLLLCMIIRAIRSFDFKISVGGKQ